MTKSVVILGCGPAGLLVAHAAELSGWDWRVYSRNMKSPLYGAQYLHQPIPQLECGFPHMVKYTLRGTPEEYRRKVYGNDWDGTVSPEDYGDSHSAWDIRAAYDELWWNYSDEIREFEVDTKYWGEGMSPAQGAVYDLGLERYDLVISTIPRKIWAQPGDVFESQKVWALGDTEMPRVDPIYRPEPFSVVCESSLRIPYYRISNIFGYCTIEWPYDPMFKLNSRLTLRSPHSGASVVEKPLRHNSTAASDFIHLGRYGAWQKGALSHDAFYEAMKIFAHDSIK